MMTNDEGFIYIRNPESYISEDKHIYIKDFTGTKQNKNEAYYSSKIEYNDRILDSIKEGETFSLELNHNIKLNN